MKNEILTEVQKNKISENFSGVMCFYGQCVKEVSPEFRNSWERRYEELENAFEATNYPLEEILSENMDIPNQKSLVFSIVSYLLVESYDHTYLTNAIESIPVADWLKEIRERA